MEEKKKHIEIHIKMDENEQITPNSKISNVSGDDVIACYLAGAVYIANIIANSSNGVYDAKQAFGEMFRRFAVVLAHFDEIMEKEEDRPMLQSEFDRLTSRPYTEAEFSEILYIYCYHPAVRSKKDIADLWTIGGICLIKDMWPTARRVEEAEHKRNAARTAYEHARDAYDELLRELLYMEVNAP